MKWIKFAFWSILFCLILLPCILLMTGSSEPLSDEEIRQHAKRLNEAAAIQIPHFFLMGEDERSKHLALLQKVEAGHLLNDIESTNYRIIFQDTLFKGQGFLSTFDGELTILHNVEMNSSNNIRSLGIKGRHDHHDVSARLNYGDVERALSMVEKASGMFAFVDRIRAINLTQKSLADIISHMGVAPHTVSIPYRKPNSAWGHEQTGLTFEKMMQAYKASQFEPVNSVDYWKSVDQAVDDYALLVGQVQKTLWQHSSWWERRIAGRFLDLQTLAPQISKDIAFRKP